jgi:hypothetical protein
VREIAQTLRRTEGAIRQLQFRGLEKLRAQAGMPAAASAQTSAKSGDQNGEGFPARTTRPGAGRDPRRPRSSQAAMFRRALRIRKLRRCCGSLKICEVCRDKSSELV